MQQNNYMKDIIKIRSKITVAFTAFIVISFIINFNLANAQSQDQKCLTCHGKKDMKVQLEDGSYRALFVNTESLLLSPHKDKSCQDCHADIVEITALGHKKNVKKVQCTRCHFENNPVGAPETEKYREFQESVHQQEFLKGNTKAPMCQNCHGSHDIKSRNSISKLELKKKITKVCGQCHLDIYTAYKTSIHGSALFDKGVEDVPACYDCHGEHKIRKIDDPSSTVYKTQIYTTCGSCHASANIVEKYGIKADKFMTFESSYHGIANQFGEKKAANCASCHGIHDIKPQSDPTSSIHPDNIVKTCGKCHPDANANYTKGHIHINSHSSESGSIFYISNFFKWITILTLTFLAIHVILDLVRKLKHRKQE
jgi:predicted CXXCH cytochrome family protein